jgi:hypothetical protein
MSSAATTTTVRGMKTPNRKLRQDDAFDSGSTLYSELRKRNERRARVAELLVDRRKRLEQIASARRARSTRHAG